MEFKDIALFAKDFQGLIGILIGVGITLLISKRERSHKDTITESERIDRYRLSSVKERLQVHQKAYILWHKMVVNLHVSNSSMITSEATEFWIENCLYLTQKCRKEFSECMMLFDMYQLQLKDWKNTPSGDNKEQLHKELLTSFNRIIDLGKIIQEEVDNSYTEPKSIIEFRDKEIKRLAGLR